MSRSSFQQCNARLDCTFCQTPSWCTQQYPSQYCTSPTPRQNIHLKTLIYLLNFSKAEKKIKNNRYIIFTLSTPTPILPVYYRLLIITAIDTKIKWENFSLNVLANKISYCWFILILNKAVKKKVIYYAT